MFFLGVGLQFRSNDSQQRAVREKGVSCSKLWSSRTVQTNDYYKKYPAEHQLKTQTRNKGI